MDIHPPERPIHSIKDFLLQLMTITVGILIALSLEGVVQWSHHRTLVREAKTRLTQEIRDNRRDIDGFLKSVPALKATNDHVLGFISDVAAKKPLQTIQIGSSYNVMSLSRTSWDTAQATGAMAYMDYGEAQKYATVYDTQAKLAQIQDRLLNNYITAFVLPGDPDKATPSELQAWRQNVMMVSQYLEAQRQLAEGWRTECDKALQVK